ncbi:MAG: M15 family metallopeptidase [Tenericutes bacterium]|nr:M15 family metallopeptidase [Mycoplasmatota bacterium]
MNYKILVNKNNKINDDYLSEVKLITTKNVDGIDVQLEEETYEAFLKLQKFLEEKGIIVGISSAFRTIERQKEIYQRFIEVYGKEYADAVVAPVGCSEHHTGLAVDINMQKEDGTWPVGNNELMAQEPELVKTHQFLAQFGFILRYPKDKENITGYPYEPWHLRFVGKETAKKIYAENCTLEEYLKREEEEKWNLKQLSEKDIQQEVTVIKKLKKKN